MSDRLSPVGRLMNPNILHKPDAGAGSGGDRGKNTLRPYDKPIQEVHLSRVRPSEDNVQIRTGKAYIVGREDSQITLKNAAEGNSTIGIASSAEHPTSALSRQQCRLQLTGSDNQLFVHNKGAGDILVFRRGKQDDVDTFADLHRLPGVRSPNPNPKVDSRFMGTNQESRVIAMPINADEVMVMELTSSGGVSQDEPQAHQVGFRSYIEPANLRYAKLLQQAMSEEQKP